MADLITETAPIYMVSAGSREDEGNIMFYTDKDIAEKRIRAWRERGYDKVSWAYIRSGDSLAQARRSLV